MYIGLAPYKLLKFKQLLNYFIRSEIVNEYETLIV